MHLIGVLYSDFDLKNIVGFRILDSDSKEVKDIPYDAVKFALGKPGVVVNGIKCYKGKLSGSNGAFDRYPALCKGKVKNNKVIILSTIDDVGYRVTNYMGDIASSTSKKVLAMAEKVGIANGKIVTKNGNKYISAISGTYKNVKYSDLKDEERNKIENVAHDKEQVKEMDKEVRQRQLKGVYDIPRVITGQPPKNSKMHEVDPDTGMTVEQKLAYAMMALRQVSPFYYCVYNNLRKVETDEVSTLGVDLETLYFNSGFVLECSLGKLLFILKHEVLHVVMKHRIREKGRKHRLWNKACDFYINRVIAVEHGLTELNKSVFCRALDGGQSKVRIILPDDALYNSNIDIEVDTPEAIYEELLELAKQQQQQSQGDDDEHGNSEGGSSGNGGSGDNDDSEPDDKDGWEDQMTESSDDGSESDSKTKSSKSKKGSKDNGDKDEDEDGDGDGDGSSGDKDGDKDGKDKDKGKGNGDKDDLVGKKFRGKEIPKDSLDNDIVKDKNMQQHSEERMEQMANSLIQKSMTMTQQQFKSFGPDAGGFMERYIEKLLAPKINWKALLRNKCTLATQKVNTFSAPDKRFLTRGMKLPGPKRLDNDAIENVKICIDTSGSISQEDLGVALGQIYQMFRQFKAKAEVLYWDTQVRAIYPFENPDELLNKKPMGGGGTDANCIFRYFEETKEYRIGLKKRPNIIIVFTDGYFSDIEEKYKKYKDTIWILDHTGYDCFKAPFGTKAPINMDEFA